MKNSALSSFANNGATGVPLVEASPLLHVVIPSERGISVAHSLPRTHTTPSYIFCWTNSSTRLSTSSSDKLVESMMVASAAGARGEAARVRSRRSRSRRSAEGGSAGGSRQLLFLQGGLFG